MNVSTSPGHTPTSTADSAIDGRAAWRAADRSTGVGALAGLRVLDLSRSSPGRTRPRPSPTTAPR